MRKNFLFSLVFFTSAIFILTSSIFFSSFLLFKLSSLEKILALLKNPPSSFLIFSGKNFLLPLKNPTNPKPEVVEIRKAILTAYSSEKSQTDDDPFITASGKKVKWGIVASNSLPFGTKIRIPQIFKNQIFIVEDRMKKTKSPYQIDIWFPTKEEAKIFGVKRTYIEILK